MVTTKKIHALDFKTIEDYFNYILDSQANGQPQQVKELIQDLSKGQKRDLMHYIHDHYFVSADEDAGAVLQKVLDLI